MWSNLKPSIVF